MFRRKAKRLVDVDEVRFQLGPRHVGSLPDVQHQSKGLARGVQKGLYTFKVRRLAFHQSTFNQAQQPFGFMFQGQKRGVGRLFAHQLLFFAEKLFHAHAEVFGMHDAFLQALQIGRVFTHGVGRAAPPPSKNEARQGTCQRDPHHPSWPGL